MQAELLSVLWPYVLKALAGLAITGTGALMIYPVKYAKREWKSIKDAVASTHAELVHQRENCLNTLQDQGTEQIKLLGKMADTLDGVRLDLAEQTGYLRAQTSVPRSRSKKK